MIRPPLRLELDPEYIGERLDALLQTYDLLVEREAPEWLIDTQRLSIMDLLQAIDDRVNPQE